MTNHPEHITLTTWDENGNPVIRDVPISDGFKSIVNSPIQGVCDKCNKPAFIRPAWGYNLCRICEAFGLLTALAFEKNREDIDTFRLINELENRLNPKAQDTDSGE